MEYFLELGNTFRTCYSDKYPEYTESSHILRDRFDSACQGWDGNNIVEWSEDVDFEYNGVKITSLTYKLTSENSADLYFDALVDMGRFWLLIPMETSISVETDAEINESRPVLGEIPSNLDWLDTSYLNNLTLSDVGLY